MITQTDAVTLAIKQLGPPPIGHATAFGFTNPYGSQCTMFPDWIWEQSGGMISLEPGYNAIDIYNKNPANLQKITNPRDAKVGDYFFMNFSSGGINYGHTGFVILVVSTGVWSIDQNYVNYSLTKGSPPAKVFHQFSEIVGLLRPPYSGGGANQVWLDKSVVDDYEAWKKTGQTLSFDPAYPAMGGTGGKPLTDTSGITTVMNDFRDNKTANIDAQPYKQFVAVENAQVWESVGGDLTKLEVVKKGGQPQGTELKKGQYYVE